MIYIYRISKTSCKIYIFAYMKRLHPIAPESPPKRPSNFSYTSFWPIKVIVYKLMSSSFIV